MDSLRKNSPGRPLPPSLPPELPPKAYPPKQRRIWRGLIFIGSFLVLGFLALLIFVGYQMLATSQAITFENHPGRSFFSEVKSLSKTLFDNERAPLRGEESGRINILLLGRAGETYPGKNLTDTIMIASIDVPARKVSLLSLPRDLYAPIPKTSFSTKLNSLYQYGINSDAGVIPLHASIENITGLKLHYFAIIDFDGFEKIVDVLGGVDVEVTRDIYDDRYPGKNYSYETFALKVGRHKLDGKTALKYVRERHDDPEGDFGRAKRQQQVLQALKDRAFSPGVFLNIVTIDALLKTLGESVKTDLTLVDIESLLILAKTLDTENPETFVVDAWKKESLLRTSHVMVGPTRVFILVPRAGENNWNEIRDVAENIFDRERLTERARQIAREEASLTILADPASLSAAERLKTLTRELGLASVTVERISPLENQPLQSIIVDRSNLAKPFSLDELLKRLPLQKENSLPITSISGLSQESDLVLLVGSSLAPTLALEDQIGTPETVLDSEALPPQPTKTSNE